MDINPMMLLPLLMQNKNTDQKDGDMDMTKMTSLMSALKGGNPEALLSMLGGDNEKMKTILTLLNQNQPTYTANQSEEAKSYSPPSTAFAGEEINAVLNRLMKK